MRVAVIISVHNRKAKTLACLESFFYQQNLPQELTIQVLMVDDGSTDGTSDAVHAQFPTIRILPGTGNLFWCGGMRMAFGTALKEDFDFYLWLNDDTILVPDALTRILRTSFNFDHRAIVVGSTQDPQSGELTYGGVKRLHRWKPLRFTRISPASSPIPVETMNGNVVLIPRIVAHNIGNLDPIFTHGIGDYDYGLRAQKAGFNVYLAPGYYGFCKRNPDIIKTEGVSFQKYWASVISYKGLPPKEWHVFAKRYAGIFWFMFWASPYIRALFKRTIISR